ncbi:MAG: hypothetical protein ACFE0Q_01670 [Anaerolineae bacterium]
MKQNNSSKQTTVFDTALVKFPHKLTPYGKEYRSKDEERSYFSQEYSFSIGTFFDAPVVAFGSIQMQNPFDIEEFHIFGNFIITLHGNYDEFTNFMQLERFKNLHVTYDTETRSWDFEVMEWE